jgi:hypothetical protein
MGVYEETYGLPSSLPWAMDLGDGIQRHPVALYEIIFLIALWLSLTAAEIEEYLVSNIDYDLGPRHRQGLQLFFNLARLHGHLPQSRPLDFTPV